MASFSKHTQLRGCRIGNRTCYKRSYKQMPLSSVYEAPVHVPSTGGSVGCARLLRTQQMYGRQLSEYRAFGNFPLQFCSRRLRRSCSSE
eukprot:IDg23344t1